MPCYGRMAQGGPSGAPLAQCRRSRGGRLPRASERSARTDPSRATLALPRRALRSRQVGQPHTSVYGSWSILTRISVADADTSWPLPLSKREENRGAPAEAAARARFAPRAGDADAMGARDERARRAAVRAAERARRRARASIAGLAPWRSAVHHVRTARASQER